MLTYKLYVNIELASEARVASGLSLSSFWPLHPNMADKRARACHRKCDPSEPHPKPCSRRLRGVAFQSPALLPPPPSLLMNPIPSRLPYRPDKPNSQACTPTPLPTHKPTALSATLSRCVCGSRKKTASPCRAGLRFREQGLGFRI